MSLAWHEALDKVRQYAFKVITPNGSGTGFVITYQDSPGVCGLATAYHVIDHAYTWEEPIKVLHAQTGKEVILRAPDRYIFTNPQNDAALVMFMRNDLAIECSTLPLIPEDNYLKPANELGWAGYPVIAPNEFSFFSGHVSCYLAREKSYLVDGVAINGVSGGPAFTIFGDEVHIVGIVSAYIPNRITGENLPGVCYVSGVDPFHEFMKDINSLEEARTKGEVTEHATSSDMVPTTAQRPSGR
jgi:hypothetical protein